SMVYLHAGPFAGCPQKGSGVYFQTLISQRKLEGTLDSLGDSCSSRSHWSSLVVWMGQGTSAHTFVGDVDRREQANDPEDRSGLDERVVHCGVLCRRDCLASPAPLGPSGAGLASMDFPADLHRRCILESSDAVLS